MPIGRDAILIWEVNLHVCLKVEISKALTLINTKQLAGFASGRITRRLQACEGCALTVLSDTLSHVCTGNEIVLSNTKELTKLRKHVQA